jgi:hypothetical protein
MISEAEKHKLEKYLNKKFCSTNLKIVLPNKPDKPAELFINNEFIGTIYKDVDEGEISYDFNMAILEQDLD